MQDKVAKEQVYVVEDLERPLLGRKPAELLKLISRLDSLSSDDYQSKVAEKYLKLFEGLDDMKESYCITLTEDAKPFQVTVPRKEPCPLYQKTCKIRLRKDVGGRFLIQLTKPLIGALPRW